MAYTDINSFWFQGCETNPEMLPQAAKRWFSGGEQLDAMIRERFAHLFEPLAAKMEQSSELISAFGAAESLAMVVLFDQFSRNCFRKSAKAFSFDALALQILDSMEALGLQESLHPIQRVFLYMPLQHAESLSRQTQGVAAFEQLSSLAEAPYRKIVEGSFNYAIEHKAIVERFGRFPHRNDVLGRASTEAEVEYLNSGGKRYGQ